VEGIAMAVVRSVAPRGRGRVSFVMGVVLPTVLILIGNWPGRTVAQGPGMSPGAGRLSQAVQEKERLEVELETTIGELNRAIAETEQALARLKIARGAARESLRAIRGEIVRPAVLPVPRGALHEKDSLYERGILLFPDSVEKAMMGERVRQSHNLPHRIMGEPRGELAPDAIRIVPHETAPLRNPDE
jgi:hypothetical protein